MVDFCRPFLIAFIYSPGATLLATDLTDGKNKAMKGACAFLQSAK